MASDSIERLVRHGSHATLEKQPDALLSFLPPLLRCVSARHAGVKRVQSLPEEFAVLCPPGTWLFWELFLCARSEVEPPWHRAARLATLPTRWTQSPS